MKLVAILQIPIRAADAVSAVASATGLTIAEARMRLAPEPPALLARLDPDRADALVATLRAAGLAVLAVEAQVPSDKDRTVARSVVFTEEKVSFASRFEPSPPLTVPWGDVLAILRGTRSSRSEIEQTGKKKSFSVGRALATGGLLMTRTTGTTVRSSQESFEQVILVYARDGRSALLSEAELDFACLGPALQPSRTANMTELAQRLRERAKGAFYDERLLRLGRRALPFVAALESRSKMSAVVATSVDTSRSFDVLSEIMRRAVVEGLLR